MDYVRQNSRGAKRNSVWYFGGRFELGQSNKQVSGLATTQRGLLVVYDLGLDTTFGRHQLRHRHLLEKDGTRCASAR